MGGGQVYMVEQIYAIYGAGGFGREVMPLARSHLKSHGIESEIVFVDDAKTTDIVNGHRVMTYAEFRVFEAEQKFVSIAIADSAIRGGIAETCKNDDIAFFSIQADNVVTMDQLQIGAGSIICPFVSLTSNIVIGSHFHANIYSYVAHDCVIGDFVTFAPRVTCLGNIVVEDHAYIGAGAILRQGKAGAPLIIGRGAVVGMGAVVTKNVAAGTTVVGNPARALVKG